MGRGQVAALVALVASAALASLVGAPPPLEPLAALVMEWTPVPIANALLDLLGPLGKPLALVGASAIVLGLSGPLALLALAAPFGRLNWLLTVVAVSLLVSPLARPGTVVGPGALALIFLGALALTRRGARRAPFGWHRATRTEGRTPCAPTGRRRFLIEAARNAGAIALASILPLGAAEVRARVVGRTVRPPLFPFEPPPARAPGFELAGLTPEVTPVPLFYRMSKNVADPVVDETAWSVSVAGRVRRVLSLTLDDLVALPRADHYITMECVSNPVGGPLWSAALFSGVPLARLLERAEPLADAAWISFEGPDGHREQLSLARALDPRILVAYGMNGQWLEPVHGFPARLVAAGLYGFRSVKWLTRIEVLDRPKPGHWEERAWTAADIHTTARVDVVRPEPVGAVAAGVAFAGVRGISAVQVRVDAGPWQPAELHTPPLSEVMWVQWRAPLALTSEHGSRVEARAIDGRGAAQDETPRGQFPNGATGLHGLSLRS